LNQSLSTMLTTSNLSTLSAAAPKDDVTEWMAPMAPTEAPEDLDDGRGCPDISKSDIADLEKEEADCAAAAAAGDAFADDLILERDLEELQREALESPCLRLNPLTSQLLPNQLPALDELPNQLPDLDESKVDASSRPSGTPQYGPSAGDTG